MNTTQAQQKDLDDALVAPADHLEFGKCNMRLKIDIKPKEATFQVVLDALALTPFYQAFLITADICRKILVKEFDRNPPYMEHEHSLFSIQRSWTTTGDINAISTVVNVEYELQHQTLHKHKEPFCYHHQQVSKWQRNWNGQDSFVPCSNPLGFTKIIIDFLMSKDQSISRRNKMFWHTPRDDTMFTSMRCISRHEDN
ncbi:hypothetical protein Tco_0281641 [Tanacetum coccineum]